MSIMQPPNTPLGRQQRERIRDRLLPSDEREELVRLYGGLVLPTLTRLLDAKVEELAASYAKGWDAAFRHLRDGQLKGRLLSRAEVADSLGISVSTIQRLEKRGELPEPKRIGRSVLFAAEDIRAFAKSNGLPMRAPSGEQDAAK